VPPRHSDTSTFQQEIQRFVLAALTKADVKLGTIFFGTSGSIFETPGGFTPIPIPNFRSTSPRKLIEGDVKRWIGFSRVPMIRFRCFLKKEEGKLSPPPPEIYHSTRPSLLNILMLVPFLDITQDGIDLLILGSQSDQLDIAFVTTRVLQFVLSKGGKWLHYILTKLVENFVQVNPGWQMNIINVTHYQMTKRRN
jgi:hypothetical protein